MQKMQFIIDLGQAQDGGWCASVPSLPGVVVAGYRSIETAREAMRIAIEMHLEGMKDDGVSITDDSLRILEAV